MIGCVFSRGCEAGLFNDWGCGVVGHVGGVACGGGIRRGRW